MVPLLFLTVSRPFASIAMLSPSSAFILVWNSKQMTPSPMSQRLAEPFRATGFDRRLMSASNNTPGRRFTDAVEGFARRLLQQRRHLDALARQERDDIVDADLVDELEGPEFPGVAPA